MKKFGGYDAIISITDGQIYGNEYSNDNYILARFDNGQPIKYWFNEPSDGSSESVFIRRTSDFIARCKKAKDIKIEIPIFEGGRPIFEFHVDEPLKWKSESFYITLRVCQNVHILFLCTKPRLSQARALLFPKVFVPLGIKKISL